MFLGPIRSNYVLIDGQNGASRNISEVNKTFESIAYCLFFYVFVSLTMISEQNPNNNLIMRRAGLNTQLEIQCKFWERLRVPRHSWSYWLNPLLDLRLDLSGRSASWCHLTFLIWKPTHEILWPIIRSTISKWKNPQNHKLLKKHRASTCVILSHNTVTFKYAVNKMLQGVVNFYSLKLLKILRHSASI